MPKLQHIAETAPYVPARSSDEVYAKLLARIVEGSAVPGERLPPERTLCEQFGVTRGVVREALRRLEHSRIIESVQGSGHRVTAWQDTSGIDILPELLSVGEELDPQLVLSVMEMRSALGPDAARLCALRSPHESGARLRRVIVQMSRMRDLTDCSNAQRLFWRTLINGSGNIAYRLAYNSLLRFREQAGLLLIAGIANEIADREGYAAVAEAISRGDAVSAEHVARALLKRGMIEVQRIIARGELHTLTQSSVESTYASARNS